MRKVLFLILMLVFSVSVASVVVNCPPQLQCSENNYCFQYDSKVFALDFYYGYPASEQTYTFGGAGFSSSGKLHCLYQGATQSDGQIALTQATGAVLSPDLSTGGVQINGWLGDSDGSYGCQMGPYNCLILNGSSVSLPK